MTEYRDACQVDPESAADGPQVCGAAQHVLGSTWPPAAGIPNSPVFQAPGRDALGRQSRTEVTGVVKIVGRLPESTVNNDDSGVPPAARRQAKIAELKGIAAITQSRIRPGSGQVKGVFRGR